jgi:hypothetical protein
MSSRTGIYWADGEWHLPVNPLRPVEAQVCTTCHGQDNEQDALGGYCLDCGNVGWLRLDDAIEQGTAKRNAWRAATAHPVAAQVRAHRNVIHLRELAIAAGDRTSIHAAHDAATLIVIGLRGQGYTELARALSSEGSSRSNHRADTQAMLHMTADRAVEITDEWTAIVEHELRIIVDPEAARVHAIGERLAADARANVSRIRERAAEHQRAIEAPAPVDAEPADVVEAEAPATPARTTWRREHGAYWAPDDERVHIEHLAGINCAQPWQLVTPHGWFDYPTLREAKAAYAAKRADEARLGYWPADPRKGEADLSDVTPGMHVSTPPIYADGTSRPSSPDERPTRPIGGGPVVCALPEPVEVAGLPGRWIALVCRSRSGATWTSYVSAARPVVELCNGGRPVEGIDLTPAADPVTSDC